jgi:hypothetical protein
MQAVRNWQSQPDQSSFGSNSVGPPAMPAAACPAPQTTFRLHRVVTIPQQAHPATIVRLAPSTDRRSQYARIGKLEEMGRIAKLRIAPVDFRPGQMLSGSQEVPK